MEIKYLGHSSFFIRTKKAKLVTDPYDPLMVGLRFPKIEADVVTVSHHHQDHDFVQGVKGQPVVIDMPGEYEVKEVRIIGYQSYHDKKRGEERGENNLYKIEAEGVSLLHCGDLGVLPDDNLLDDLGTIDLLMVPVGGFYTIDSDEAVRLMRKIEPSIVIPMHYNHPQLNQKVFNKIAPLDQFLDKVNGKDISPVDKLKIKKEELEEEMRLVVMKISSLG